jgi:hypothetical protein
MKNAPVLRVRSFLFDPSKILNDLSQFETSSGLAHGSDRFCLTQTAEREEPLRHANKIYDSKLNQFIKREHDFEFLNTLLEGTYTSEVINHLRELIPLKFGRIRFMRLPSRSCYSVHRDDSYRLHLPLLTDRECYMCFFPGGLFHLNSSGRVYLTNTMLQHTAMNCSAQDRIHLVINTVFNADAMSAVFTNTQSLSDEIIEKSSL